MAFADIPWSNIAKGSAALMLAFGSVYYYTHDTPPNRAASEKAWLNLESEKEKTKQIEFTAKPGSVSGGSPSEIVALKTFSCQSGEELRVGMPDKPVQVIFRSGVQYRLPQGCAVVQVNTYVHALAEGSAYLIKEMGQDIGCGTFHGRDDSVEDCAKFLNRRQGKYLKLFAQGDLIIN